MLKNSKKQVKEALSKANETKVARFALREGVRAGTLSIKAMIAGPPQLTENMEIDELLRCLRRVKVANLYAKVEDNSVCNDDALIIRIRPNKELGKLSPRERNGLVRVLQEKGIF